MVRIKLLFSSYVVVAQMTTGSYSYQDTRGQHWQYSTNKFTKAESHLSPFTLVIVVQKKIKTAIELTQQTEITIFRRFEILNTIAAC